MRLIDADAYERDLMFSEEVYEAVDEDALRVVLNKLSDAPTVDAVTVVRCKDCKNFYPFVQKPIANKNGWCTSEEAVRFDDYCSRGERKVGQKNDALDESEIITT